MKGSQHIVCCKQGWQAGINGTDLWSMLQQSFGWVTSSGYTSKGNLTTLFPVVVGEFGSNYADPLVRHPHACPWMTHRYDVFRAAHHSGGLWQANARRLKLDA